MPTYLQKRHSLTGTDDKYLWEEVAKSVELFVSNRFIFFLDELNMHFSQQIVPLGTFTLNII